MLNSEKSDTNLNGHLRIVIALDLIDTMSPVYVFRFIIGLLHCACI